MKHSVLMGAVAIGAAVAALAEGASAVPVRTGEGQAAQALHGPGSLGSVGRLAVSLAGPELGDALQTSPKVSAVYKSKCLVCHGPRGQGDGPGAKALNPKPRSFRDPAWQQSITDEQIRKATTDGGAGVGKSPAMPAVPALKNDPTTLDGLVALVRSFKD